MESTRISRDLRTPLAVMTRALQMAQRYPRRQGDWVSLALEQAAILERAIERAESALDPEIVLDDASVVLALETS